MKADEEKIIKLIEPLLWATTFTAEEAYHALKNDSSYGKHIKAKLLSYTSWYKLISNFEIKTIFSWLNDEEVISKLWPKAVMKK